MTPFGDCGEMGLGRRTLQAILKDQANATGKNLYQEIQRVLDSKQLPSHVSEVLHAVREVGNFAAHPIKSTLPEKWLMSSPAKKTGIWMFWSRCSISILFSQPSPQNVKLTSTRSSQTRTNSH